MKYRIIEKTVPKLTLNYKFEYDFIPEIEYSTKYIVQVKESFIYKWMDLSHFSMIEQARVYVEFLKIKQTKRIVE